MVYFIACLLVYLLIVSLWTCTKEPRSNIGVSRGSDYKALKAHIAIRRAISGELVKAYIEKKENEFYQDWKQSN